MNNFSYRLKQFLLVLVFISFSGCGGSSDKDPDPPGPEEMSDPPATTEVVPETQTGIFIDSPVAGINYTTETQSGVTNPQGEFSYIDGETITFSIGDISLPSTLATSIMTPLTLVGTNKVNDISAVNIARFLQSLDEDGDPSNGITINEMAHSSARGIAIEFDAEIPESNLVNLTQLCQR